MPFRFFSFSGGLVLPELLTVLPVLGLETGVGRTAVGPKPPGTEYHVESVEASKGMEKRACRAEVMGGRRSRISSWYMHAKIGKWSLRVSRRRPERTHVASRGSKPPRELVGYERRMLPMSLRTSVRVS